MAGMMDMARDLGGAMARTEEYQALRRAISAMDDDRDMAELRTELTGLEGQLEAGIRAGKEPDAELAEKYEDTVSRLQASPVYQRLVSGQANFDKIVFKVNETIAKGIEEGATSRIVLPL